MISYTLPGRIRLRHPASLPPESLEELAVRVRSAAPSAVLTYSPKNHSTLILFDEKDATSRVVALFPQTEGVARRVLGPVGPLKVHWPHMRQIKRGMIVSLLASLGLAAVRREGAHVAAGGLFLGLLARHL